MQENILVKVGADISNFANGMGRVSRELSGIGSGLDKATGKQKSFIRSISEVASGIGVYTALSKAIGAVTRSLDGAISRYDTLNNFPRVLQQIGFSAEDSQKAINRLSDGIQGLPTTLDDVASTAQRIAVMTGDLNGAVETTLALNNAFISSGSNAADASRGLEQYVQMLAKGEVDLQSWRTLQETMGVALNDVAKAFGFAGRSAQNDLYDALKDGKITFDEFNKKIIELSNQTGGFAERALTASGGIRTAWTNMRTAIVRGVTKIIEAIDNVLKDTPLESIENIINKIGKSFYNVLNFIASNIPPAIQAIKQFINAFRGAGILGVINSFAQGVEGSLGKIVEIINAKLPEFLSKGKEILLTIIDGIVQTVPQLGDTAIKIGNTLLETLLDNLPMILEAGAEMLLALIDGIVKVLPSLANTAVKLVETLLKTILSKAPTIIDTGMKVLLSVIKGILNALPQLLQTGVRLIINLASTLIKNLPEILAVGLKLVWELIKGITKVSANLLQTGVKLIATLAKEMLRAIPKLLGNVGKAIVEGIWSGIKGAAGWLKDKVSGFFSGIVDWGKSVLGINSPSKAIRDQIGQWIPAGLVEGINSQKNAVIKAAEQMAQWATPDVPDISLAYSTPNGIRNSLASAVRGTVSLETREDMLVSAVDSLARKLDGMEVVLDGRIVGKLIAPTVSREINAQTSDAKRGGGYRGRIS